MKFDTMEYDIDAKGRITAERVTGEVFIPCDDVILAIGQENAFPWIEEGLGIEFDKWHVPKVDKIDLSSPRGRVCISAAIPRSARRTSSGRSSTATRPQSRSTITAWVSPSTERLPPTMNLSSRKMGLHEWSYKNDYNAVERRMVPHVSLKERFKKINIEVELGFGAEETAAEVQRCLNCDVQTVFEAKLCIECDACIDICPTDCLTITANGRGSRARDPPQGAAQAPRAAALCFGRVETDRPRHGQR